MGLIDVFRQQTQFAQRTLTNLLQDVDDTLANWKPGGRVSTIGEMLLHALTAEDIQLHRIQGQTPLLASAGFAQRLGVEERSAQMTENHTVNMAAVQEYMQALFSAVDRYLEGATDADLERVLELAPGRSRPVYATFSIFAVMHLNEHAGEISCIKGLRGLQGY